MVQLDPVRYQCCEIDLLLCLLQIMVAGNLHVTDFALWFDAIPIGHSVEMFNEECPVGVNGICDAGEVVAGWEKDRLSGVFSVRLNQGCFYGIIGKEPAAAGHQLVKLAHYDPFPNELSKLFLTCIAGSQKSAPFKLGKKIGVVYLGEHVAGREHIFNALHRCFVAHSDA